MDILSQNFAQALDLHAEIKFPAIYSSESGPGSTRQEREQLMYAFKQEEAAFYCTSVDIAQLLKRLKEARDRVFFYTTLNPITVLPFKVTRITGMSKAIMDLVDEVESVADEPQLFASDTEYKSFLVMAYKHLKAMKRANDYWSAFEAAHNDFMDHHATKTGRQEPVPPFPHLVPKWCQWMLNRFSFPDADVVERAYWLNIDRCAFKTEWLPVLAQYTTMGGVAIMVKWINDVAEVTQLLLADDPDNLPRAAIIDRQHAKESDTIFQHWRMPEKSQSKRIDYAFSVPQRRLHAFSEAHKSDISAIASLVKKLSSRRRRPLHRPIVAFGGVFYTHDQVSAYSILYAMQLMGYEKTDLSR